MKFEDLKPDMVVYDCHSQRMGNTVLRTLGVWPVRIISVDPNERWVEASWNGNRPTRFYGDWRKWTKNEPHLVRTGFGQYRRETRDERKARMAQEAAK